MLALSSYSSELQGCSIVSYLDHTNKRTSNKSNVFFLFMHHSSNNESNNIYIYIYMNISIYKYNFLFVFYAWVGGIFFSIELGIPIAFVESQFARNMYFRFIRRQNLIESDVNYKTTDSSRQLAFFILSKWWLFLGVRFLFILKVKNI